MYSCSPTLSQISLKNSFGKVVFQILERYNIFKFFLQNCDFFIVHTYMVQISLQNSGGKVVFLRGVPWNPPWAPTGVKVPWSLTQPPVTVLTLLYCSHFVR